MEHHGGHLAPMNEYEDYKGESMSDFIHTKYGTNLPLNWTSTDTRNAFGLGKKVRGEYREETQGGDEAKEVKSEAWHAILAFEARHRILAERSSTGQINYHK